MRGRKIISLFLFTLVMLSLFLIFQQGTQAQGIDFIVITDSPNGAELSTVVLDIGGQVTAYASGFNFTSGYVGLVEVDWSGSGGVWSPGTGTNSTYTAGGTPGLYSQTGYNATLNISDTFNIEIISPAVDYIIVRDESGGGGNWVGPTTYIFWDITEVGKWALLSLLLPLYSRIKKEELLDQPIRYKIHGYLIGKPGAHFGLIKQDLHIPNGQLVYHLKKLMTANLIYSKEDGIKKRFYPKESPEIATGEQFKSTEEKILELLENNSGANQKEIASSMGVSRQVVGYHLNKMEEKGYVRKELEGRETRYYPLENRDV